MDSDMDGLCSYAAMGLYCLNASGALCSGGGLSLYFIVLYVYTATDTQACPAPNPKKP